MSEKKKLYLVKREVYAKNIEEAMKNEGDIYAIELVDDRDEEQGSILGFNSHDKKK